eukprot:TRINITY_DN3160_c0_g1_i1.p1 TRINITY_DN3160_c0_g1~~TRINITY_DN3160_c0_g1_i1.p1  ORF type:complete len:159 (+),score=14.80 TRINITY_DN3160_c0_g1_i1:1-477(+)
MTTRTIQSLGLLGILVCLYAIYVEHKASTEYGFTALCDFDTSMSCSKVLTSKYARMTALFFDLPEGHILNVPNTYFGVVFYVALVLYPVGIFKRVPARKVLLLVASIASVCSSTYLGYILYYVLEDFCIVCVSTYVINALVLVFSVKEFQTSHQKIKQ